MAEIWLSLLLQLILQLRPIHLIWKDASQIIHRCYSNSSLVLARQTFHHVFHGYRVLLGGRWLSHERRRIWRETEWIHLREVNRCMLTGARKNDDVQQVGKLLNARNWWREAMIYLSFTDWIAIVMKIQDPRLQLCILYTIKKSHLSYWQGTKGNWIRWVASWLVPWHLDRALAGDVALCSWEKHLTLTVPPSTQVFNWLPANLMLGVTLR